MKVVLISTYELGHQPFGVASPAAWLRARGAQVVCMDLSRETLCEEAVRAADLVAFYVPMHTATRLATQLIATVRQLNARAHLCFYGLYAPVNENYLRASGVESVFGGEFEAALAQLTERLMPEIEREPEALGAIAGVRNSRAGAGERCAAETSASVQTVVPRTGSPVIAQEISVGASGDASGAVPAATSRGMSPEVKSKAPSNAVPVVSLDRLNFLVPDRTGLPPLHEYAHVTLPDGGHLVAGYTEASRGCKHLCRHCPIVPVYNGAFRIVSREVVLADIRQQVGAGAQHITFGDPDFFNGPAHALAIVREMHREFPNLSYDVTIKIEHLLNQEQHLATLRDTGCLFVTTAVESVDDAVLERLAKGHTRADFLAVVANFRKLGLVLQPTFVPFTPWTTFEGYRDLLSVIAEQDLVENIAPIQLGIRLLVPAGSRMLELPDMRAHLGEFDEASLYHTWKHSDPRLDALAARVQELAATGDKFKWTRTQTFARIWEAAATAASEPAAASTEVRASTSDALTRAGDALEPLLSTTRAASENPAAFWHLPDMDARPAIPHFTEPWYCCAEPTKEQFISIGASVQPTARPDTKAEPDVQPDAQPCTDCSTSPPEVSWPNASRPDASRPDTSRPNASREISQHATRADGFL